MKNELLTQDILALEINNWMGSDERKKMLEGQEYYVTKHAMLKRDRKILGKDGVMQTAKNLANNKLVHAFIRKLVDQKVGYLLGKPLSIQTKNDDYLALLNEYFNKAFLRLLKNVGKDAINKGRAWLQVYYDENGMLSWKRIPPEEIIPFWKDSAHTELEAVIRIFSNERYEDGKKIKTENVEYWHLNGVQRFERDGTTLTPSKGNSHFIVIKEGKEQEFNWDKIPFICFKYNDEELPILTFVKSLIDDYDQRKSDNSNILADTPNSVYILKNYDGQDLGEFRENLVAYQAVKVSEDGGVDTLNLEINTEAHRSHIEAIRKDIYEFGRGVDTQSDKFGNSPSGIALKFLYGDLDMDANIIETEFQAALEHLLWFINQHIANTEEADFSNEVVEFIFNRDIIINETDSINNAKTSIGVISEKTIVANHPWTTDTKKELEQLAEEKKQAMNGYMNKEQFPQGSNNEQI